MKVETPVADQLDILYSGQEQQIVARTANTRRWVTWAVVALLLAAAAYVLLIRNSGSRATSTAANAMHQQAVPVVAARAKIGDLNRYLTALGSVTAFYTVTIRTQVNGQLVTVNFKEGQLVREGDLLAQVDPRPYQAALEQAQGQLAKDKASAVYARVTLARDQTLFKENVISRDTLDDQSSMVGQFDGAIVSDQANIDSARLNLIYSRITSPITGRIGLRLVDPGNIVHTTDTNGIAVITQLQPIAVLFSIPEDDIPQVVKDTKSGKPLPVEAWDRSLENQLATGTLQTFSNQIDPTTGTLQLKAVFQNEDGLLFPNQFVNARLLVDTMHGAVLVPAAAVQRQSNGAFVYVIKPDNTAEVRTVKIGATQGEIAAIASGVQAGELVVTDGVDKLQQGSHVNIQMAQSSTSQS